MSVSLVILWDFRLVNILLGNFIPKSTACSIDPHFKSKVSHPITSKAMTTVQETASVHPCLNLTPLSHFPYLPNWETSFHPLCTSSKCNNRVYIYHRTHFHHNFVYTSQSARIWRANEEENYEKIQSQARLQIKLFRHKMMLYLWHRA